MGVDSGDNKDEGAGDQGLMFGYACDETDVLMPAAIHYSHQILKDLATVRKQDADSILGPDSKSQISLVYDDAGRPTGVHKVVLSTQHSEKATQADILALVTPVIANVLPDGWMVSGDDLLVNPTGQFVIGGPDGDTGLTGRKIIVDTYGGAAPHGGGAFSGKDPTKVDRSAAYASRYLAKNVVAAGLASRCTIQIAYAIGVAEPVSLYANTHGTGTIDDQKLQEALRDCMDLTPRGIRQHLGMNAPIYAPTAAYGHFGRIAGEAGAGTFSWEATDLVDALRAAAR
jgi:S-adenosylmethionine synthetase